MQVMKITHSFVLDSHHPHKRLVQVPVPNIRLPYPKITMESDWHS